ncbi:COG1470 family protein [[Eubacterium] cellulosolvens]
MKENEKVNHTVVVSNFGSENDNITFNIKEYLDFPGTVELEFDNVTLKPRESKKFRVMISIPANARIGLYFIELSTKSSLSEAKSDPSNQSDWNYDDEFGYEGSVDIKVVVVGDDSDPTKQAEKPAWEVGYEWLYSMNASLYSSYDLSGNIDLKITDDTKILVNDESCDVYKVNLGSELQAVANETYAPFYGTMDLLVNGTSYFQSSDLGLVKQRIMMEYTMMDMMGGDYGYGSEIVTTYDPPLIEYDFPIKPGEQWLVKTNANMETREIKTGGGYGNDDSYTYDSIERQTRSYICLGTDTVTTPAGTFEAYLILELERETEGVYDDLGGVGDYRGTRATLIDFDTYNYDEFNIDYYSPEVQNTVKQVSYSLNYNYNEFGMEENVSWEEGAVVELISYSLKATDPGTNPSEFEKDQDKDAMPDTWEDMFDVDDPSADSDNDGFTNLDEFQNGTDPMDSNDNPMNPVDEDEDGMPDTWERYHGLDPTDPFDAITDPDKDGFTNEEEFDGRTSPNDPLEHPPAKTIEDESGDILRFALIYIFITIGIIFILILFTLAARRRRTSKKSSTRQGQHHEPEPRVAGGLGPEPTKPEPETQRTQTQPQTQHKPRTETQTKNLDQERYRQHQQYYPPSSPPPEARARMDYEDEYYKRYYDKGY